MRALDALPPGRRSATAAAMRSWLSSIPGQVEAIGPGPGLLAFGWLTPFVCRVQLQDFDVPSDGEGKQGTTFWMDARPLAYVMRMALRLDEPAAVMSALAGGQSARSVMRDACLAIYK
jgi:hypothetical protein